MFPTLTGSHRTSLVAVAAFSLAALSACGPAGDADSANAVVMNLPSDEVIEEALASITEEEIREYTQVLASDEFGGRAPSSRGRS